MVCSISYKKHESSHWKSNQTRIRLWVFNDSYFRAVYLCDSRFDFGDIKAGISSWIKPAIRQWNDDAELYLRTSKFFTSMSSNGKVEQVE